ncbi:MAG TPA: EAL domain-containing protein, partial [Acetobacteraceae bacterium]
LCAGLGMTTTAEGVETEEQLDKICAEGCTEAQGFLFSPPRPAGEIPAILERVRLRDAASHHGEPVPVMPIRSGRAPAPEMVAAG